MRVERFNARDPICIAVTGDGTDEFWILDALAQRFNGDKVIFFPKPPRKTGLSCLESIPTLAMLSKTQTMFLCMLDHEHIDQDLIARAPQTKRKEAIGTILFRQLHRAGIGNAQIDSQLPGNGYRIDGVFGPRKLVIFIVITGFDQKIEEQIARLILLEKNRTLQSEKNVIRDFFNTDYRTRSIGKGTALMIKTATKDNLRSSFPGLSHIIGLLEHGF